MKKKCLLFIALAVLLAGSSCQSIYKGASLTEGERSRVTINPITLNYQFQRDELSRREAADPVIEYYKGKYYLFASVSNGYWVSDNMNHWRYIPCTSIQSINNYAPSVMVRNDSLYFIASGSTQLFRTGDPDSGKWEKIPTKFHYGMTDPCLFNDGDRVYMYWGCSDKHPIVGVEIDPNDDFRAIGEPDSLIYHEIALHGWEVPGRNNDDYRKGWNEGPAMIKLNGKYYLQYAAPGTQCPTYGDGVYVSDNPLGPFVYQEENPFSFKPGGFIRGAGHGHTFYDRYGNLWHTASMRVSVRHGFERRLGLFPTYLTAEGTILANTAFSDYPFLLPDKKVDFENTDLSMGWNLLSYNKAVMVSSTLQGMEAQTAKAPFENARYVKDFSGQNAVDEAIETWWSAQTGKVGEWMELDLGEVMTIQAIHLNFADQDFNLHAFNSYFSYRYVVEGSADGRNWAMLIDKSETSADAPHDFTVFSQPLKLRYLRLTNKRDIAEGRFSVSGFRVFGWGNGKSPARIRNFEVKRDALDARIYRLSWEKVKGATGYVVRWGTDAKHLYGSYMIYGGDTTVLDARFFNRDSHYYFTIDTFNENGLTRGKRVKE